MYLIANKNYFQIISNACLLNDIIVTKIHQGHYALVKEKTKDSHKGCQSCPWNYTLLFHLFQLSQLARAYLKRKKENLKFPGWSFVFSPFCRKK